MLVWWMVIVGPIPMKPLITQDCIATLEYLLLRSKTLPLPLVWILNDFQGLPEDPVGKAMATAVGRCWHQHGNENHSLETSPYRLGHGTHQRELGATCF